MDWTKVIVLNATFKELEKIDTQNQKLIFAKIKDLESGIFTADKALRGKHKGKFRKRAGNYRIIYLKENDISSGVHYPISLPKLKAYDYTNQENEDFFANSSDSELLSLPIGDHLSEDDLSTVIKLLKEF